MQLPTSRRALWLVIPSFNDSKRLARFLPELCAALESSALEVAIQTVDDGSSEADKRQLNELVCSTQNRYPFVRTALFQSTNQGKGAAIMRGWEAADGNADWLGFLDADGAIPAYEVRRVTDLLLRDGNPNSAIFASRVQLCGRKVERSLKRHFTGRIFASMVGTWIDPHVYDSQCGFKLISREAYRKIQPLLREKRFAFDVELLAALNHRATTVEEVPVDWTDIPGSKVALLRDSLQMFRSVRTIHSRMKEWH
ncbi:MAG: glycosyltransferase [Chthoniobacteraceae bacterium]